MKQDDYGFAPKKLQILGLQHIETATDLINNWVAMNTKTVKHCECAPAKVLYLYRLPREIP